MKCGIKLAEDATYCSKCGTETLFERSKYSQVKKTTKVVAAADAKILRCPSCGAPISPHFGEMVITCKYCGSSVALGTEGWKSINKHSMIPIKVRDRRKVERTIHDEMNRGLFRVRIHERSTLEEMNLTYVPFWIISVSARTNVIASDTTAEIGTAAATAALFGTMASGSGRRGGLVKGALLGSMMSKGSGGIRRSYQISENHNYPVVALKALSEFQPHDFEFDLEDRYLFDSSKVPKGIEILNGDISEQDAKYMARTLVDQLQSQKAHAKYHMIQHIETEIDIGEAELLHVPVWAARYRFRGRKIVMVIDGNSGGLIHSVGLD